MARPLKDGIDYFPFDVGFLQDKKIRLIKGEFGVKGVLAVIQLLCSIYKENGYFSTCDNDDCILVADAVGCGCDAKTIREVVQGCLRRSVFDDRVFETFGVLTSRGIQRRYLRALSTRENIDIYKEYWLLDINDKKDVPASISKKITFKSVAMQNNEVSLQINDVDLHNNPLKKRKEKKSRIERNKEDQGLSDVVSLYTHCGFLVTAYTADELTALLETYPEEWVKEAIRRSVDRGKKTLGYVKGILNSWQEAGAMDDVKPKKQTKDYVPQPNTPKKYVPPEKGEVAPMPEELRSKLNKSF